MIPNQPKVVRSVVANAGATAKYRKQLLYLIEEMGSSVVYWLTAAYNESPPLVATLVAQDASPTREIQKRMRELSRRWLKRFDALAPKLAELYVKGSYKATETALKSAFRDAGFTVKFNMTPAMRDALEASIGENIGLIKSIPQQYLQQVEGIVNRSYAAGRDLATMTKEIRAAYPKAQDRAVLIARDQSNKLNATVTRARQMELGITEAIWKHSHAGKHPRPSHVAADGKRYKIAEGCLIDGEYIQPGEEINCRCTSRAVLPGL